MAEKRDRSLLIPLLILGFGLPGFVALACFVPMVDCKQVSPFRESGGLHMMAAERNEGLYLWPCRGCGGDFRATLLQRWIGREDGTPPPSAARIADETIPVILQPE